MKNSQSKFSNERSKSSSFGSKPTSNSSSSSSSASGCCCGGSHSDEVEDIEIMDVEEHQ